MTYATIGRYEVRATIPGDPRESWGHAPTLREAIAIAYETARSHPRGPTVYVVDETDRDPQGRARVVRRVWRGSCAICET